jgi:pimeloyl-ACP methyl ester carboxylesterase
MTQLRIRGQHAADHDSQIRHIDDAGHHVHHDQLVVLAEMIEALLRRSQG